LAASAGCDFFMYSSLCLSFEMRNGDFARREGIAGGDRAPDIVGECGDRGGGICEVLALVEIGLLTGSRPLVMNVSRSL